MVARTDTYRLEQLTHDQLVAKLRTRLAVAQHLPDDDLADAIMDAVDLGVDVDLAFFLDVIRGLETRPVAMDAAIDVVVQAMVRRGNSSEEAVRILIENYPHLETAIRTAWTIDQAIPQTTLVAAELSRPKTMPLPCAVGPLTERGAPRYTLHQILGVGSQGCVYLAQDSALSQPGRPEWVAIKVLHTTDPDASRLRDEAYRVRLIHHPSVVRVRDRFVLSDGQDAIVFDHVRGGTLEAWRRSVSSSIDTSEVARLVSALARGVQAAHNVGVIHRDIKPSNVLLADATPKLSDFGIAESAVDASAGRNREGSLGFMAPEQYRREPRGATIATDVYGLGAIMHWLVAGTPPNGTDPDAARQFLSGAGPQPVEPPACETLRHQHPELDAIRRRALSHDLSVRYQSADALANDLDAWRASEVIEWTRPTTRRRLHLWSKRAPRSAVVVLGSAGLAVAAVLGLGWGVGEFRKSEAKMIVMQAQHEKWAQVNQVVSKSQEMVLKYLASKQPHSADANWLVAASFTTEVLGEPLIRDSKDGRVLWENRIETAGLLLKQAAERGGGHDLESLMLESCLGLWLVNGEKPAEGRQRLDNAYEGWKAILNENDPWLDQLDTLRFSAAALEPVDGENTPERRKSYLGLAQTAANRCRDLPRPIAFVLRRAEEANAAASK